MIDIDLVGIFYIFGSIGKLKGVVFFYCNMVVGVKSVVSYLENYVGDMLLVVLLFFFDVGFS